MRQGHGVYTYVSGDSYTGYFVENMKNGTGVHVYASGDRYEGSYTEMGDYPAWEYRKDSPLRDTMVRVYKEMTGKEAQVVAIHAGLECGLLSEKLPGLDCVSIGPEMHDIHTSRETLGIASTERTWKFLLEILKNL